MKKSLVFLKKNWTSILFYFFIFLLFMYEYTIICSLTADNFWNYGAAYGITNGMVPYRDFNLLTLPLAPFIISMFMHIFGSKMIVYYAVSALFMTGTIYLLNKLEKSVIPIVLMILITFAAGSYNCIIVNLILLLIYLEKNKKDDFLIGIVIGLLILTKQVMAVLLIPILMTKDLKKITKRIIGAIIPCELFLMYLLKNDAFFDCINYAFLGMLDFGGNNGNVTIWTFLAIYICLYFIYQYIKTKDLNCIYGICSLVIAAPLFDIYHTLYAAIPYIIYTCASNGKLEKITKAIFSLLLILTIVNNTCKHIEDESTYYVTDKNNNYYLILTKDYLLSYSNDVYDYYQKHIDEYEIYFLDNSIYYVKLEHNIPINKFDLFLYGNNGYDGTNQLKNKIKNMNGNVLFIVDETVLEEKGLDKYSQINYDLIEFVINNYEKVDTIRKGYNVYKIVND